MSRREWALLAAIVAGGALIRFLTLDHQSYDHDEAVTAGRVLHHGLGPTLHAVAHGERSPPLYYLLAWLWSKPFGTGEVGLRSLSALFGTLTIPLAYRVAAELGSRRAGLYAAALVAANPYLIWYSQEARSYALLVLFGALALVGFARSLRSPSGGSLTLWAVASVLALYSHYFAVFLIVPQAAWLVWTSRPRLFAAIAAIAVLVAGLAIAPYASNQEGSSRRNGFTQISLAARTGESALNFVASEEPDPLAGSAAIDAIQIGAAAVGGLLLIAAAVRVVRDARPRERRGAIALGAVGLGSMALPIALAIVGLDYVNPRNLIGAVVPLLAAAAIGFGTRRAWVTGAVAAATGVLLFGAVDVAVLASAQMQRPDWRGAAAAIGPAGKPRILVVNHNGDDPLDYYLGSTKLESADYPARGVTRIVVLGAEPGARSPGDGFEPTSTRRLRPTFTLTVFAAPRPERPPPAALGRVLQERSSLLLQKPPR